MDPIDQIDLDAAMISFPSDLKNQRSGGHENEPMLFVEIDNKSKRSYTVQCGGYACKHPEERGHLIYYLHDDVLAKKLDEVLYDNYGGWCCDGITKSDADSIDEPLEKYGFRVDRGRLDESMEAWVYLIKGDKRFVLAYVNSD